MDLHNKKEGKAKAAEKPAAPKKPEPVIYLGPYIKGLVNPGVVFTNGLPGNLKQAVKELPEIGELCIPISQAVAARKKLSQPGSSLSIFYSKAQTYRKEI